MNAALLEPPSERQNKGTGLLVVAFLLTFIASIVLTLRLYIRTWVNRTLGWDDGLITVSLVSGQHRSAEFALR